MSKRISDEVTTEEIKKSKSDAENNLVKTEVELDAELIDAEAEKFLLLFDKTFSEHHQKKLNDANLDCEDGIVDDILTKITKQIRENILSNEKVIKATKFLKVIHTFNQYLIVKEMARTRGGLARRPNNFDNRRFGAAKEIANARRRNDTFKIKLLLPQGRNVEVKVRGDVVRRMGVRRRAIFPASVRERQY